MGIKDLRIKELCWCCTYWIEFLHRVYSKQVTKRKCKRHPQDGGYIIKWEQCLGEGRWEKVIEKGGRELGEAITLMDLYRINLQSRVNYVAGWRLPSRYGVEFSRPSHGRSKANCTEAQQSSNGRQLERSFVFFLQLQVGRQIRWLKIGSYKSRELGRNEIFHSLGRYLWGYQVRPFPY